MCIRDRDSRHGTPTKLEHEVNRGFDGSKLDRQTTHLVISLLCCGRTAEKSLELRDSRLHIAVAGSYLFGYRDVLIDAYPLACLS